MPTVHPCRCGRGPERGRFSLAFGDSDEAFSSSSSCGLRHSLPKEWKSSGHLNCQLEARRVMPHLSHLPCFLLERQSHLSSHGNPTDKEWEIQGKQTRRLHTPAPGSLWSQWEVSCSFWLFSAAEMKKQIANEGRPWCIECPARVNLVHC